VDTRRRRLANGKEEDAEGLELESSAAALFAPASVARVLALAAEIDASLPAGERLSVIELVTRVARHLASGALMALHEGPCSDGLNLTCDISRVFDDHLPLSDGDNDTFAGNTLVVADDFVADHFRGASWRGRDCNDGDGTVYPGRRSSGNASVDANCNGISGVDPASGTPYEELFCSGANAPMGLVILGDSAAAHFHLPPQYLNANTFNLSGLLELAANEADWPACSWSTGFRNASDCPRSAYLGNVTAASVYARMRALNRCMHRDYQNIGVNGARTGSMAPPNGVINALQRNQMEDAPLLVIFALIGNDVCNGHPGTGSMTTVDEFRANVLASLAYLDTVLPTGSHVAFLGLVDGRVLFNTTHAYTHPTGATYPEVYEYLSCSGANPCW
jgi:acyloxyacyl hydrolase